MYQEFSTREEKKPAKWDSLSAENQAKFEAACNAMSEELKGTLSDDDAAAAAQAKDELGVTFLAFGQDDADTFRNLTAEVWADWGAKSPDAQALVDSHTAFLSTLGLTN